jgi:hypothetical protein
VITSTGTYEYFVHRQIGGSAAEGDPVINTGKIDWTGSTSASAASGAMSGSAFRDYVLRLGFKRTDKDTELYEAVTDAIQIMRRRFMFDEAEVDSNSTDSISVLGDFKLTQELDMGLLLNITLQDGTDATVLEKISKAKYDELYPDVNVTADRGYPEHFCIYAGRIYLGPIPNSVAYTYRLGYSKRAGTIIVSTTGVPFTDLYRDVLADLTLSRLYDMLEDYDKAAAYLNKFEIGFASAVRRERANAGLGTFNQVYRDC